MNLNIDHQLRDILDKYKDSFNKKVYREENNDHDVLMDVFGLTPELKRENGQYWGGQLGRCWEKLICKIFEIRCENYQGALKVGRSSSCDCRVGMDAIEVKYRIGSGDSGFAKKARQYAIDLMEDGYNPILLILREDNLPAAISNFTNAGWQVFTNAQTFEYIAAKSKFDLLAWLISLKETNNFKIER